MKEASSIPSISSAHAAPTICPSCQSSLIVTKAKSPDADSYWRCTKCGEVWNVSRSQISRRREDRWR